MNLDEAVRNSERLAKEKREAEQKPTGCGATGARVHEPILVRARAASTPIGKGSPQSQGSAPNGAEAIRPGDCSPGP